MYKIWLNRKSKIGLLIISLTALMLVLSGCSNSQQPGEPSGDDSFPSKQITCVVPAGAGGGYDTMMRALSTVAQTHFGQPLIIENRSGGNQAVGLEYVKNAKPDGYTIVIGSHGSLASSPVQAPVPYDPLNDYEYIVQLTEPYQMLAVSADSPFNTVEELVEYARANPGKVTLGHSGTGGIHYFAIKALAKATGADIADVPFPGSGESAVAVAGGHITGHVGSSASTQSLVDAGKVKLLASAMNTRDPHYPDVPTIIESGYEVKIGNAWGLLAPKGTPDDVIQKLYEGFKACSEDEAYVALADKLAIEINIADGPAFRESIEYALNFYEEMKE